MKVEKSQKIFTAEGETAARKRAPERRVRDVSSRRLARLNQDQHTAVPGYGSGTFHGGPGERPRWRKKERKRRTRHYTAAAPFKGGPGERPRWRKKERKRRTRHYTAAAPCRFFDWKIPVDKVYYEKDDDDFIIRQIVEVTYE